MTKLTFAFDCQLNDEEDYIKEGTIVEVYPHLKNGEEFTAVIIDKAWSYEGEELNPYPTYEIFMNTAFKELR
jgi:hypothetical protein